MSLVPIGAGISHVTVLREEQPEKHLFSKLVTEEGILMDVREEQIPYLYIVLYQRFMH